MISLSTMICGQKFFSETPRFFLRRIILPISGVLRHVRLVSRSKKRYVVRAKCRMKSWLHPRSSPTRLGVVWCRGKPHFGARGAFCGTTTLKSVVFYEQWNRYIWDMKKRVQDEKKCYSDNASTFSKSKLEDLVTTFVAVLSATSSSISKNPKSLATKSDLNRFFAPSISSWKFLYARFSHSFFNDANFDFVKS